MAAGAEAPAECSFPPGTPLEFAGRSTTATLDVQEAVGDPMSDDPADIYITRDAFDQGELHGRLVCAIFVNQPGFVEITPHQGFNPGADHGPDQITHLPDLGDYPLGPGQTEGDLRDLGDVDALVAHPLERGV